MNLLIVDDQKAILESLKEGIDWKELGITELFTAISAKEARLVLSNFDIDIVLSDIEMPEENGIDLMRWAIKRDPHLVGVFLTSHADFSYAQEALHLGGFDYVLQPARNEDIIRVIKNAIKEVNRKSEIKMLEKVADLLNSQRDGTLEFLLSKDSQENGEECLRIFKRLQELFLGKYEKCVFYPMWVLINFNSARSNKWDEELIRLVLRNVLEELFVEQKGRVCIAKKDAGSYLIFVATDEKLMTPELWKQGIMEFSQFINGHMDFSVAVYPESSHHEAYSHERIYDMQRVVQSNVGKKSGVVWMEDYDRIVPDEGEERIKTAILFMKSHLSQNYSRAQVAESIHLNEEYFSRLFKKHTGYTFKEYDSMLRMEHAKSLLEKSKLSISIIASKCGYDNFSHFSKVFKKYTDKTPQEYRKLALEKKS